MLSQACIILVNMVLEFIGCSIDNDCKAWVWCVMMAYLIWFSCCYCWNDEGLSGLLVAFYVAMLQVYWTELYMCWILYMTENENMER